MNEFKKFYHLRTNLVKDENGDLFAESQLVEDLILSAIECTQG
jgi:hypothetical protein